MIKSPSVLKPVTTTHSKTTKDKKVQLGKRHCFEKDFIKINGSLWNTRNKEQKKMCEMVKKGMKNTT